VRITQKQLEAIIALPGPKRYEHFVKVAADQRRIWGLYSAGWALAGTANDTPVFPVWPAREYALRCAAEAWSDYEPKEIDLDEVFDQLLPDLRKRGTQIGVFYTPNDNGVIPSLDQFENDLRSEVAKIG
jgi:hypothetical protein